MCDSDLGAKEGADVWRRGTDVGVLARWMVIKKCEWAALTSGGEAEQWNGARSCWAAAAWRAVGGLHIYRRVILTGLPLGIPEPQGRALASRTPGPVTAGHEQLYHSPLHALCKCYHLLRISDMERHRKY